MSLKLLMRVLTFEDRRMKTGDSGRGLSVGIGLDLSNMNYLLSYSSIQKPLILLGGANIDIQHYSNFCT